MARNRIGGAVAFSCIFLFLAVARPAETLPAQLSDEAFWTLVTEYSEAGGTFISDNFVSNERSFLHVLPELVKGREGAGAYIGVGPEQNFTYIAALKPQIAFVIDIRRQNMVELLMYKALFEISTDRADFLSRLFSRARPKDLGKDASVTAVFEAFQLQLADSALLDETVKAVRERLVEGHKYGLTEEDTRSLEYILRAFYAGGPNLTYNGPRVRMPIVSPGVFVMPTIAEIMVETTLDGQHRSFLATEEHFRFVQQMQKKNLIIPLVGDFGGPKAIRSVGDYLRGRNAMVSAFYTSNVEQYLFMSDAWERFYKNTATLPVDPRSVFIRGLIRNPAGFYSPSPAMTPLSNYETRLFSISDLMAKMNSTGIQAYADVVGPVPEPAPVPAPVPVPVPEPVPVR